MTRRILISLLAAFAFGSIARADCDAINPRHFKLSTPELHVETGYIWKMDGQLAIAGGCGFVNAPGSPPQPTNPFTVTIDWGDGQTSPLTVGVGGATTSSHTYTSPSPKDKPFVPHAYAHAYGIAGWGQFWETVTNLCSEFTTDSSAGKLRGCDVDSPVRIYVHERVRPTGLITPTPLVHGAISTKGLTIILETLAPESGTSLEISSSNSSVKIVPPTGTAVTNLTYVIQPGKSSADLDIDATAAGPNAEVTFTVKNPAGTKTVGPIKLQ
jgi:hypothetical protein